MKQKFKGWINRDSSLRLFDYDTCAGLKAAMFYKTKREFKDDSFEDEPPPKKVKVTITIEEVK